MGVMSRRVLPVCGSICIFCPSLRARSRQPVKRYKKLLAEIFPKNQEIEPNDRKIGKLCEYVSKNPLRVPKITEYLEQRFYKDLRNENVGSVKVVLCVYRKFISSCKEQMPLFSCSLLEIIRTLLDQTCQEELQILGCNALVDFVNVQVGSTYMFNIEGLVLKLCQLAQEVGDDDRALCLRAAGLQALSSVVRYMGEQSHIPMEFDKIISATLDDFVEAPSKHMNGKLDGIVCNSDRCSRVSTNTDDSELSSANPRKDAPPLMDLRNIKQQLELPLDAAKNPSYWSKVCLYNMFGLAKETTTIRRVLEPFFHNFDSEEYWSPERGLACSVLMYMQVLLEDSAAENSHLLISILVKHLDHKHVAKQPLKQISIIHVIRQLVQHVKQQASGALTSALTDMLKLLRKCMQYSEEAPNSGSGEEKLNADLQSALEICISQLSSKIGDVGPILDMMAMVLENVPNNNIVARTTIFSVYRTAQIISSLPNVSYSKKTFPDALFHPLLMAMGHPDRETRTGAHRIFSTVLMPSLICPWSDQKELASLNCLGPSAISTLKANSGRFSSPEVREEKVQPIGIVEDSQRWNDVKQSQIFRSHSKSSSFKSSMTNGNKELARLRLSSHQVSLLLSSIWVQATSRENTPSNFEAMAHTYNIALLLTRTKTSSHMALVRCFQLAFSLRTMSLDQEGGLQPSRRRSLFTMASCMIIFSARAGNLPELIPIIKSSLTDKTVDPYLELVDNSSLHAVTENPAGGQRIYGSEEDDFAALKSLSVVESNEQQLKETVICHLMSKFEKLSEDELSGIKNQLLQGFSPDESYPLGAPLFMETPQPCSPQAQLDFESFDEMVAATMFDESLPDTSRSQSGSRTSNSSNSLDILNVNQLLESVLETAQQVASLSASTNLTSYDQVKDQCEALVTGKQQKMSVLQSFKQQLEAKAIVLVNDTEMKRPTIMDLPMKELERSPDSIGKEMIPRHDHLYPCSLEYGYQSFRLPPASPYDKFLKASGC